MSKVIALICGVLFGSGLIMSEMVNPKRVKGFLDLFGDWDPTLIFVMLGALFLATPAMLIMQKMKKPIVSYQFEWPTRKDVDARLIIGSILFGVGWGLSGFCPGPVLVSTASLEPDVYLFCIAMIAGMLGFQYWDAVRLPREQAKS